MPWTQASDVTNDNEWAGRCSELDIFELIDPIPPDEFEDVPTSDNDLLILEGFELDDDYVDGTHEDLFDIVGTPAAGSFSISTTNRGATVTGGKSLKAVGSTTVGGIIRFPAKIVTHNWQYFRVYIYFETITNGNGNLRGVPLFGWVDSTGNRSHVALSLAANGTTTWTCIQASSGGEVISAVVPVTGVWYRCELVTEVLAANAGMVSTVNIYLGDTDTLVTSIECPNVGIAMGGFPFIGLNTTHTGNAVTAYFDDVRIQTGTPTKPVIADGGPMFGPGGIWPMVPADDFDVDWTPLAGENWANVDEFPLTMDSETTYVSSSGASLLRDLYSVAYVPDTIPNGKYIKVIHARMMVRRVSGSGDPTHAVVYQTPLETIFTGPTRGIEDAGYTAYPYNSISGNNRLPAIFLRYEPGLPTGFRNQHKIGMQRNASSPTATTRVTMMWGYVEVSASV